MNSELQDGKSEMKRKYMSHIIVFIMIIVFLYGCKNNIDDRTLTSNQVSDSSYHIRDESNREVQASTNEIREDMDENDAEDWVSIDNKEFNYFVNLIINPTDEEEIVKAEWIEENVCFRVSIERPNQVEDYYAHHDDYIFIKDGTIKWFKVDYPNHKDLQYPDRHVWAACDFNVRYEDVTFDGNKDILIFLGHAGSHGSEVFCAYIYSSGNFWYTKSFENIPNYSIDYDNKIIRGWNTDSASTYHTSVYKFVDGEFVVSETEHYEYNPESGEYELIKVE